MPVAQAAAKDIKFKSNWNPEAGWESAEAEIVLIYSHYSQNVSQKGLLGAKEIAKKALSEGATVDSVAQMLTENNPAYFELVSSSGAQKAQQLIITKAQTELKLLRQNREASQPLPENQQSRSKNR